MTPLITECIPQPLTAMLALMQAEGLRAMASDRQWQIIAVTAIPAIIAAVPLLLMLLPAILGHLNNGCYDCL